MLDWVDEGGRGDPAAFGAGLAAVHAAGADDFGGAEPLRLGPLTLPNDPAPDWPTFYAEHRLLPLLPSATLAPSGRAAVERVCDRIADLAGPPEPPARLHGDLWSGNVLWGRDGRAWLIDPGGVRRPPRGRPRDAAAVRRPRPRTSSPPTTSASRSRPATRSAWRSTSCSRCSSTPRCSAAATRASAERAARVYA